MAGECSVMRRSSAAMPTAAGCAYYYQRAVATGSSYWWERYYDCARRLTQLAASQDISWLCRARLTPYWPAVLGVSGRRSARRRPWMPPARASCRARSAHDSAWRPRSPRRHPPTSRAEWKAAVQASGNARRVRVKLDGVVVAGGGAHDHLRILPARVDPNRACAMQYGMWHAILHRNRHYACAICAWSMSPRVTGMRRRRGRYSSLILRTLSAFSRARDTATADRRGKPRTRPAR